MKVIGMIDKPNSSWNTLALGHMCIHMETNQIKNIALLNLNQDNILCWQRTTNGHYTVKPGYQTIMELSNSNIINPTTSDNSNPDQRWTKLWKLRVSPKQLIFYGESSTIQSPSRKSVSQKVSWVTLSVLRAIMLLNPYNTYF
jgi:hypothetical protein